MRMREALAEGGDYKLHYQAALHPITFRATQPDTAEAAGLDNFTAKCVLLLRDGDPNDDLGALTARLLVCARAWVGPLDSSLWSYGLVRRVAGEVERSVARLHAELLGQLLNRIDNNATAFHADERLSFEDVLNRPLSNWKLAVAPLVLALIDLALVDEATRAEWEGALWNALPPQAIDPVLDAIQPI